MPRAASAINRPPRRRGRGSGTPSICAPLRLYIRPLLARLIGVPREPPPVAQHRAIGNLWLSLQGLAAGQREDNKWEDKIWGD